MALTWSGNAWLGNAGNPMFFPEWNGFANDWYLMSIVEAVKYDGIAASEWASWKIFNTPDDGATDFWYSASTFQVTTPAASVDFASGSSTEIVRNTSIRITAAMEVVTVAGGKDTGVAGCPKSAEEVLQRTLTVRNLTVAQIDNISLFVLLHGHPSNSEAASISGKYTAGSGYAMALYDSDVAIGMSPAAEPDAFGFGLYPETPTNVKPAGIVDDVEGDTLDNVTTATGVIAGAMRFDIGSLASGASATPIVVNFWAGRADSTVQPMMIRSTTMPHSRQWQPRWKY